jgi:hypothetical protein
VEDLVDAVGNFDESTYNTARKELNDALQNGVGIEGLRIRVEEQIQNQRVSFQFVLTGEMLSPFWRRI